MWKEENLFVFNCGGIKPRWTPDKEVRSDLLVLAWVTNMSTSPDLYIDISTEYYIVHTLGLVEIFHI